MTNRRAAEEANEGRKKEKKKTRKSKWVEMWQRGAPTIAQAISKFSTPKDEKDEVAFGAVRASERERKIKPNNNGNGNNNNNTATPPMNPIT